MDFGYRLRMSSWFGKHSSIFVSMVAMIIGATLFWLIVSLGVWGVMMADGCGSYTNPCPTPTFAQFVWNQIKWVIFLLGKLW